MATPSAICATTAARSASSGKSQSAYFCGTPGKCRNENRNRVGKHAVRELRRKRVLEQIEPPGRKRVEARRNDLAIRERPCIRSEPAMQAGHECARDDLEIDERRERGCAGLHRGRNAWRPGFGLALYRKTKPERVSPDGDGQRKMHGKPVLADIDAVRQPAFHHEPAERALRSAQHEQRRNLKDEPARDGAAREKHNKWNKKDKADQPPEQPVRPFPPVDRLESVEAHARIDVGVLRDLSVFLEGVAPVGFAHWRNNAKDRRPFCD